MALADTDQARYNNPAGYNNGSTVLSDIDNNGGTLDSRQINVEFYHKKALIEAAKETYFGALADTQHMP